MKNIHIIHLGIGNVGREVVRQIISQQELLEKKCRLNLTYCGLFNSRGGIFATDSLKDEEIGNFPHNINKDIKQVIAELDHTWILIDTTASDEMYPLITLALQRGAYVVVSNKKPLTRSQKEFDEMVTLSKGRILYETTVGAGLPIISTIKSFLNTGDEIIEMNGCFSGTLGFILSSLEDGVNFSRAIQLAREKGFTEPDPRDDLSGLDVARKALILARLTGQKMELSDIKLEKLYPSHLENIAIENFMREISTEDKKMKERIDKAIRRHNTLRYVARIWQKGCNVGLQEVPKSSDIGNLKGPDNIISIKTERYFDRPLVIKGPGAGPEVTAAGVFGDILKIGGIL